MGEIEFQAFYKADKRIYEGLSIDFANRKVVLWDEEAAANFEASFDEVELIDKNGTKFTKATSFKKIYEN